MDITARRKRATILATTPAALLAAFVALLPRISGSHLFQAVLAVWLLICIFCIAFAMHEFKAIKQEENAR